MDVGAYVEASTNAIIKNGNNDITHAYIALGKSGNRQGSINCFNLDTGRVVVRRAFKQIIWPERLLRKANAWGKKGKKAILKSQIKFRTAEFIPKQTARWLAKSLKKYCCYMHEVDILLNWPLWTRNLMQLNSIFRFWK